MSTSIRGNHTPEPKRFKGVRYPPERRSWVAEMKPPKNKNKVSLGDFKSQTEAARAVDVAFYHYGKTEQLNFADTPQILSALPTSAGLSEEDKLNLVKEQAKWLASMASSLPSAPCTSSVTSEIPESSRGCTNATLGFGSFLDISSSLRFGGTDEVADDGVSQPQPCLPNFSAADRVDAVNKFQGMCLDFRVMSPPAISMFQMESPRDWQGDVADSLLEQQSFGWEELSRLM